MKTWLNKKSIVALALAVILLLPSVLLSACGSNKPADNETTKPVLEGTKKDTEKETEKDTEAETTEQATTEEVETTKEEDTRSPQKILYPLLS